MKYKEEVKKTWNQNGLPMMDDNGERRLRSLIRYGTLAPSSHNTQCWKFVVNAEKNIITVLPDFSRRCPCVDPDDHHLYTTLGCAIENIVVAAPAHGLTPKVDMSKPADGIIITFTQCEPHVSQLFRAIPNRQCTRNEYDGKPLTPAEIKILENAAKGDGVKAMFLTDEQSINDALKFIILANTSQMDNPEFLRELKSWIRFSGSDATYHADGLYGICMGSPSAPRWIGSRIFDMVVSSSSENAKVLRHVKSSSGLAVFVSEKDDPKHWVEAGRCYERFALQATAMGIRNAFLNMPVEEADIRPDFAASLRLSADARPDLVVRFGRGEEMPRSLRRPVDDVLEYAN
mmetsp:Transcript_629/g.1370  ORF Transcript_629/g.1370 Transcript_629/m.1370 type:complete len:346 (+) Transcript_629:73-1110(+)